MPLSNTFLPVWALERTVLKLNLWWAAWVCSMELHKAMCYVKGSSLSSLPWRPRLHEIPSIIYSLALQRGPQHHRRWKLSIRGRLRGILSGYDKTLTHKPLSLRTGLSPQFPAMCYCRDSSQGPAVRKDIGAPFLGLAARGRGGRDYRSGQCARKVTV